MRTTRTSDVAWGAITTAGVMCFLASTGGRPLFVLSMGLVAGAAGALTLVRADLAAADPPSGRSWVAGVGTAATTIGLYAGGAVLPLLPYTFGDDDVIASVLLAVTADACINSVNNPRPSTSRLTTALLRATAMAALFGLVAAIGSLTTYAVR